MDRIFKKSPKLAPAAVCGALSAVCFLMLGVTRFYIWLIPAVFLGAACVFVFLLYLRDRCKNPFLKKIIPVFQIVFLLLCSGAVLWFVILQITGLSLKNFVPDGEPDYVVVLGAKVNGSAPSTMLKKRLDTALGYVSEHRSPKIVLCGGKGADEQFTEASVMAEYLKSKGVDPERLILEESSSDTRENLLNAKALTEGEDPVILVVSNGFHLSRARLLARRLGFEVFTLAAPGNDDPFVELSYRIREFCGIAAYSLGLK